MNLDLCTLNIYLSGLFRPIIIIWIKSLRILNLSPLNILLLNKNILPSISNLEFDLKKRNALNLKNLSSDS